MTEENFDPAEGNPFVEGATPEKTKWFTLARRKWIYNIVASLMSIAAVYFAIDTPIVDLWINFVGVALGLSGAGASMLARAHLK